MSFDVSVTLEPASDQLDSIDLANGPRVFTISGVRRGSAEQPVIIDLAEFPRPWKPGKNMRRVLAGVWGTDASAWVGHQVELFRDPDVRFGKETPGGTRIRRMSHIDGPKEVPLLISQGRAGKYTVEPLEAEAAPTFDIDACDSIPTLRREWKTATAAGKKAIERRVKTLEAEALGELPDGGSTDG